MARKRTRPVRVEAAYDARSHAICPLCYSRPSVAGRQRRDVETRSRGWGSSTVEKVVKYDGKTYGTVSQIRYPCSNSQCLAEIVVEWYGDMVGVEGHAHLLKKYQLKGDAAKRYEAGVTDGHGVWHDGNEVITVPTTEPEKAPRKRKNAQTKAQKAPTTPKKTRSKEPEHAPSEPKKRGKKSTR